MIEIVRGRMNSEILATAVEQPPWGMIADDLTGACDAGSQFSEQGFKTRVIVERSAWRDLRADLIVLCTDSRGVSDGEARSNVQAACEELTSRGIPILMKKIDSTLRGHVREELQAVLQKGGFSSAVVNPAFPRMDRILQEGRLHSQTVVGVTDVHLPSLLAEFDGVTVPDAATDEELACIATQALETTPRPLLVGSAGLSSAIARHLRTRLGGDAGSLDSLAVRGPIAFVIGSTHAVTQAQVARLVSSGAAQEVDLAELKPDCVKECIATKRHIVIRIRFGHEPENHAWELPRWFFRGSWGGVVVSGGDTASVVCRSGGITSIELGGEVLAGVPWGRPIGDSDYPWLLVTKGGSFGAPGDLAAIGRILMGSH